MRKLFLILGLAAFGFLASCNEKASPSAERQEESGVIDETEETAEEVGEEIGEAAEDAADEVDETAEEVGDELEEGAEETEEFIDDDGRKE